ncbi:MAG TPA: outer membrane protein transport protein [Alphaproteobacteria bacterium]
MTTSYASDVRAGAFLMQEQSAKGSGRAFAGEAAIAEDASTIFSNPAGMTELSGTQFQLGGYVLKPEAKLSDRGSTVNGTPVGGVGKDQGFDAQPLSYFYAATPLQDDLWFGFAVNVPFGLADKYKSDYFGRYDSIETRLVAIDAAPSLAYAISPQVSIGGGIDLQYMKGKLANALPNPFAPGDPSADGKLSVEGDSFAVGYNLGILVKPTRDLNLGLTYRAALDQDIDGTATQTIFGTTTKQGAKTTVALPDSLSLAAAYKLTADTTLLAQANYYNWSRFDALDFSFADGSSATVEQKFRDSYGVSVGAQHRLSDAWTIRSGVEFDQTPTRDAYRSTAIPDADRIWLGVGASYAVTQSMSLDVSYAHMFAKDAPINRVTSFPALGTTVATQGMTETSSDVLGIGLQVSF